MSTLPTYRRSKQTSDLVFAADARNLSFPSIDPFLMKIHREYGVGTIIRTSYDLHRLHTNKHHEISIGMPTLISISTLQLLQ